MPSDKPRPGDDVLTDGVVFRLAKVDDQFPADSKKPLRIHFRLTNDDFEEGRWLLTVWDLGKTTPNQARAMMTRPGERIAFRLMVPQVHAITLPQDPAPLRIIRRISPTDQRPGADGHCGILGLRRDTKTEERAAQDKLVEIAISPQQSPALADN